MANIQTIDVNSIIHKTGPWHYPIFAFVLARGIPIAHHILFISAFGAPKQQNYWCSKPDALSNWTMDQWIERGIPKVLSKSGQFVQSKCSQYRTEILPGVLEPVIYNETIPCQSWIFDRSFFILSLQDQYDLVCQKSWYISLSQSSFMAVIMFGNILFAFIADKYGRRKSLLWSTVVQIGAGFATAFAPNFWLFNLARVVIALGVGGHQGTVLAFMLEAVSDEKRGYTVLGSIGWCIGCLTLPLAAYFLTDWRYLQIIYSLSTFFVLFIWCCVSESPRWLLASGRTEKAQKALHKVESKNRLKDVDVAAMFDEYYQIKENQDRTQHESSYKPSYADLFRTPGMRLRSCMIFIMYFANRLLSFHLAFFSAQMGGNPFLGFALVNLFTIPADILCPIMIKFAPRRWSIILGFGGTAFFILLLIPFTEEYLTARITTTILAKNCIQIGGFALSIYGGELLPTVVRAMGLSGGYTASRIGAMLSPFFKELAEATSPAVAAIVSAGVGIFGGAAACFLPETLNTSLPNSIEDVEEHHVQIKEDAAHKDQVKALLKLRPENQ